MPTQRLEGKRVEERMGEGKRERKGERERQRTHAGEKERESWLLLLYVFASTWACPMQIGLSQECCFFYLKSSLWSSELPCFLATATLNSISLFYLLNRMFKLRPDGHSAVGE